MGAQRVETKVNKRGNSVASAVKYWNEMKELISQIVL